TMRQAETVRAAATSIAGSVPGSTVLDRLAIATPNQVNIRVKFARVDRNISKSLGFNLTKTGQSIAFTTSLASAVNTLTANIPATGSATKLTAMLDLLATEGLSKTLAEPNLTVGNGQEATFNTGVTLFFPTPAPGGGSQSTITPQDCAVQLRV